MAKNYKSVPSKLHSREEVSATMYIDLIFTKENLRKT